MGVDNFGEPDTPETVDFSEAQPYTEQEKKEIKINQRDKKTNFSKYMTDEKEKRQQK